MNTFNMSVEDLEEIVELIETTISVLHGLSIDKTVPGHVKHAMQLRSEYLQKAFDKYMSKLEESGNDKS